VSDDERRAKVYAARRDETLEPEQVMRIARKHLPWRDWLLAEFCRYWYWLGVLALDVFGTMEVARAYHVRDTLGITALAIMLIALLVPEVMLYLRIWPEGGLTRFDRKT